MPRTCTFCAIVAGTVPHDVVGESDLALAFMNAHPAAYGHMLVIPKRHANDIWDLPSEEGLAVWSLTQEMALAAKRALIPDGLTLFQANRTAGWQSEFHFHFHVVPRWLGDPLVPNWDRPQGSEDTIGEAAERLRTGRALG
jgi:histidine triad (HIT) family protein